MKKFPSQARWVPLLICSILVACGGGGGDGSSSSSGSGGRTTAPGTGTTVVRVDPLTAPAGSLLLAATPVSSYSGEELAAYNTFNTARTQCGFGYLTQNTRLDTAAFNHINWMVNNNTASHYEVSGTTGFTGINPWNRMTAAGYNWSLSSEVMAVLYTSNKTNWGTNGARSLLAAPYHLQGLMWGVIDIGISVKSGATSGADINAPGATPVSWLVADTGSPSSNPGQAQTTSQVLTYPCQGSTNTAYEMRGESPNPIPGRDLASSPIGQPIFVQVLHGQNLTINSATLTGPFGSVVLRPTMTASNDPNARIYSNQAMIIPDAPLTPNTTYTASITGTNNSTAFSRTFTFTTGS